MKKESVENKTQLVEKSLAGKVGEEEIENARKAWESDMDNDLRRFQYACVLARSPHRHDRQESILHLEYLISNSPDYLRDSLYQLATVRYLLHDYEASRNCAEELCRIDPDNQQVKNLFIAAKYQHDKQTEAQEQQAQNVTIAVGAGLALTALAIGASFLLGGKKK